MEELRCEILARLEEIPEPSDRKALPGKRDGKLIKFAKFSFLKIYLLAGIRLSRLQEILS